MQEDQSWRAKRMILTNQYIPIKTWLTGINCPYLCFWFTLCKGLFSWGKTGKKGNLWNFDARSQILKSKTHNTTTPLYENQTLAHKDQFSISLIFFHHVQGSFFLRKGRKKRWFVTYSCVKPNLDLQNTWYYHNNIWQSNLVSQASIGYIHVFDSPCARVFFPEKMWDKEGICEILMCEAQSWQAKGMILPHH